MKGDATIEVSSIKGAMTIPVEALFNENGKNFVYRVVDNKLVKTDITVGATTDTEVEVLRALQGRRRRALGSDAVHGRHDGSREGAVGRS